MAIPASAGKAESKRGLSAPILRPPHPIGSRAAMARQSGRRHYQRRHRCPGIEQAALPLNVCPKAVRVGGVDDLSAASAIAIASPPRSVGQCKFVRLQDGGTSSRSRPIGPPPWWRSVLLKREAGTAREEAVDPTGPRSWKMPGKIIPAKPPMPATPDRMPSPDAPAATPDARIGAPCRTPDVSPLWWISTQRIYSGQAMHQIALRYLGAAASALSPARQWRHLGPGNVSSTAALSSAPSARRVRK